MGLLSFLKGKNSGAKIPLPPLPAFPSPQPAIPQQQSVPPLQSSSSNRPTSPDAKEMSQSEWQVYGATDAEKKDEFPSLNSSQTSQQNQESPQSSGIRQVDDFGIPIKEDLELPEISMPKFRFPAAEEKEE
ncbi:MAG: hypothetical protein NT001_02295, partial [Candidatus Woesearchaeota archaeon]|nr:hypothetical protein [Candidatus Woesearchaeota archaeon]